MVQGLVGLGEWHAQRHGALYVGVRVGQSHWFLPGAEGSWPVALCLVM
jgi:hypothetical protein